MRIRVMFDMQVPKDVLFTDDLLDEWIRWSFRDSGAIAQNNPLEMADPEPMPVAGTFDYIQSRHYVPDTPTVKSI